MNSQTLYFLTGMERLHIPMSIKNPLARLYRSLPKALVAIAIVISSLCSIAASGRKSAYQLKEECTWLIDHFDHKNLPARANELLKAAKKEKNQLLEGYAYSYLGGAQLFNGNSEGIFDMLNRSVEIANKLNNDTLLSIAYNTLGIYEATIEGNLHLAQRYFLKSRHSSQNAKYDRISRSIGSNLAEISILLKDTAGIKYALECYEYGIETKNPTFEYSGVMNLAELYKISKDYTLADKYAAKALQLANEHGYNDKGEINIIRADIALGSGKIDEAEKHIREAIKLLPSEKTMSIPKAYLIFGKVLRAKGEYGESLRQLELGEKAAHDYSSFTAIAEIYELMADNYESLGQMGEAFKYLRIAKDSTENSNETERKRLDNERSLILDLEENENKVKMQTLKVNAQNRLLISLSVVIVLLIVILIMVIVTHRRKKQLYSSIVSQNIKRVELSDELADVGPTVKEVPEAEETIDNDNEQEDRGKSSLSEEKAKGIYMELCRLMKEEQLYADPQITREIIIERLGTNRTYFTQIISRYGWKNYSQFINSFRVDEAVRILSDRSKTDIKIAELSSKLGFGSAATFTKIFTAATGVSPTVFRKSL